MYILYYIPIPVWLTQSKLRDRKSDENNLYIIAITSADTRTVVVVLFLSMIIIYINMTYMANIHL